MYYLFTSCSFKVDYMFRPCSLNHNQVISLYRGNYTMYDTICEIKSLLFNEISFFVYKNLIITNFSLDIEYCEIL